MKRDFELIEGSGDTHPGNNATEKELGLYYGETPEQITETGCALAVFEMLTAHDGNRLNQIELMELGIKDSLYAEGIGMYKENAVALATETLDYGSAHFIDDKYGPEEIDEKDYGRNRLLGELIGGDSGIIFITYNDNPAQHVVGIFLDESGEKFIIRDPAVRGKNNPTSIYVGDATLEGLEELLERFLSSTNSTIDTKQGFMTVSGAGKGFGSETLKSDELRVAYGATRKKKGDVKQRKTTPARKPKPVLKIEKIEEEKSIIKSGDWLTKQEDIINEEVSRLKTEKGNDELGIFYDEAMGKKGIGRENFKKIEKDLNEFYNQNHRPQMEVLKGKLRKTYEASLNDAFQIDLKRAVLSFYRLQKEKEKEFDETEIPKKIEKAEKFKSEGERKVGDRKISQISVILETINPNDDSEEEINQMEEFVQGLEKDAIDIVEQLRELGTTDKEKEFFSLVNENIMNPKYDQGFLELISKWLEKDGDTDQERATKISLQHQFRKGFQPIIINSSPQQEIKELERLALLPENRGRNEIRNILHEHGKEENKLTQQSMDSIINALMSGLKISEINNLNSSGIFNFSNVREKSALQKQLLQAAIEYADIAEKVAQTTQEKMRLSEYAKPTDEDENRINEIVIRSELSLESLPDIPFLKTEVRELNKIRTSINKLLSKHKLPRHHSIEEQIDDMIQAEKTAKNNIIEYIQDNIDEIANLYRKPEEAIKMSANFVTKIINVYLDRLTANIANIKKPSSFDSIQKDNLERLKNKLRSEVVLEAKRATYKKIKTLEDKKEEITTVIESPYLKRLRRQAAKHELDYLEQVKKTSEIDEEVISDDNELKKLRDQLMELYEKDEPRPLFLSKKPSISSEEAKKRMRLDDETGHADIDSLAS